MHFLPSLEQFNAHADAESRLNRFLAQKCDIGREGALAAKREFLKAGRVAYTIPAGRYASSDGVQENLSILLACSSSISEAKRWMGWRRRKETLIGFSSKPAIEEDWSPYLARGDVGSSGGFPQWESEYVCRLKHDGPEGRRAQFL